MKTDTLQGKVKETLEIWRHNRQVYPGWLLLPADGERERLRTRTNNWEGHILAALPAFTVVERLNAIYELTWRREILLEPISEELESAAAVALESVDCQDRTVNGIAENEIDWSAVREVWREVALTLATAARFRFNNELFDKRTELLEPFANDHPDVHHRLRQERCLWTMYSMDFESLESLLDNWTVKDSDPIWMVRKAALLWETNRNDEAADLITDALELIRDIPGVEGSVSGESREGWAMWSAVTGHELQEFRKRWHELAALKCDAELEKELIARRLEGDEDEQETPTFDLGVGRGENIRFSSASPELAAYRAVRLSEVAGLPPVTNHNEPIGLAVASGILKSAAELLASSQPEFAIRLVLRVSESETDKALNRVLSRTRAAILPESSAEVLGDICFNAISYAFPRLIEVDKRSLPWVTRMRVATEVLSRLALRVSPDRLETFLDLGLQGFQSREVALEIWLHRSVANLLRRSWEALPKDRRAAEAVNLLSLPIVGMDNFSANVPEHFPDPGEFLKAEDLPDASTLKNDSQWHDVINFLIRGLEGGVEARSRALNRITKVFDKGLLDDDEVSAFTKALWSTNYTAPDSLPTGTHLYDWAFLLLPEPSPGIAEQQFRHKWLSGDISRFQDDEQREDNSLSVSFGARPVNPNKIEDVFWNVGAAISELRRKGRPLQLTDDIRKYIEDLVAHWAKTDVTSLPFPFFQNASREPTRWALRGLASILEEMVLTPPVGEILYEKLRKLTDSAIPAFEPIHGLVRIMPERLDELVTWLRMGLASEDDAMAASAMSSLLLWLTESVDSEKSLLPPPADLLREVGVKIASRSSIALPQALQLAAWVFREGTSENQQTVTSLVTQGLSYLAEELRYDREHKSDERSEILPLLRLRCAQLAQAMAQSGLRYEPAVDLWLTRGEEDPLPEVRYTVTALVENDEAG